MCAPRRSSGWIADPLLTGYTRVWREQRPTSRTIFSETKYARRFFGANRGGSDSSRLSSVSPGGTRPASPGMWGCLPRRLMVSCVAPSPGASAWKPSRGHTRVSATAFYSRVLAHWCLMLDPTVLIIVERSPHSRIWTVLFRKPAPGTVPRRVRKEATEAAYTPCPWVLRIDPDSLSALRRRTPTPSTRPGGYVKQTTTPARGW